MPADRRRERADKVLAAAFPEHSRVAFQRALVAGLVKLDGKVISQAVDVQSGQTLEFSFPEVKVAEIKAVDIPLNVIFEDKHLIVLNKAAGMVVHPGIGTGEDTMVHALLAHCGPIAKKRFILWRNFRYQRLLIQVRPSLVADPFQLLGR